MAKKSFIIYLLLILLIISTFTACQGPQEQSNDSSTSSIGGETVQEQQNTVEMIPTSANLIGAFDQMLFLPINGATYRYEKNHTFDVAKLTVGELIFTFEQNDRTTWKIYALEEYSDRSMVYATANNGTGSYSYLYSYAPPKAVSDEEYEQIKNSGYLIIENGDVQPESYYIWQRFYAELQNGEETELKLAKYYTLRGNYSQELYESIQEDYPALFLSTIRYDGEKFSVITDEGTVKSYLYLMEFEGSEESLAGAKKHYALTNDNTIRSYDVILRGMLSSQSGDFIDHYLIFSEPLEAE